MKLFKKIHFHFQVNLIIFVDPKSVELVYHRRKLLGFANKTKVTKSIFNPPYSY